MASPAFFLQSLLRLADPRLSSALSKFAASCRSSSSRLFYGFPEGLARTNCQVHYIFWFHYCKIWGKALKNPSAGKEKWDSWKGIYDVVLTILPFLDVRPVLCNKTVTSTVGGTCSVYWRLPVLKDTLINKGKVKANQSLSFIKHSSIRTYGRVKL
jgi:hypothetical protein